MQRRAAAGVALLHVVYERLVHVREHEAPKVGPGALVLVQLVFVAVSHSAYRAGSGGVRQSQRAVAGVEQEERALVVDHHRAGRLELTGRAAPLPIGSYSSSKSRKSPK